MFPNEFTQPNLPILDSMHQSHSKVVLYPPSPSSWCWRSSRAVPHFRGLVHSYQQWKLGIAGTPPEAYITHQSIRSSHSWMPQIAKPMVCLTQQCTCRSHGLTLQPDRPMASLPQQHPHKSPGTTTTGGCIQPTQVHPWSTWLWWFGGIEPLGPAGHLLHKATHSILWYTANTYTEPNTEN